MNILRGSALKRSKKTKMGTSWKKNVQWLREVCFVVMVLLGVFVLVCLS